MTHAEQEAKLRLVGQVAAKVWPKRLTPVSAWWRDA
jgi:hypothetical protein